MRMITTGNFGIILLLEIISNILQWMKINFKPVFVAAEWIQLNFDDKRCSFSMKNFNRKHNILKLWIVCERKRHRKPLSVVGNFKKKKNQFRQIKPIICYGLQKQCNTHTNTTRWGCYNSSRNNKPKQSNLTDSRAFFSFSFSDLLFIGFVSIQHSETKVWEEKKRRRQLNTSMMMMQRTMKILKQTDFI